MPPKKSSALRVGAYARVSTHDQQTLPLQKRKIREYAKSRGLAIVHEYQEVGSGAKLRPMREELMRAARRREIDLIVVWKLDRWGRSVANLVSTLNELRELGVGFISLTEALDFSTPSGQMAGQANRFARLGADGDHAGQSEIRLRLSVVALNTNRQTWASATSYAAIGYGTNTFGLTPNTISSSCGVGIKATAMRFSNEF